MRNFAVGIVASTVALSSVSWAATQAELDTARDKAVAWLVLNQQADGRWVSAPGLDIQTTAAAVEAMQAAGQSRLPRFAAAVAWLQNAEASSNDALARQVIALKKAGVDVAANRLVQTLLARRNAVDKGWGAYPGFNASVPDTPIALSALKLTGQALTDGATLEAAFNASSVSPATGQRYWLHVLGSDAVPQDRSRGEPVMSTALTVLALKSQAIAATAMNEAVAYIKTRQSTAGANLGAFTGADGQVTAMDTAVAGDALAATAASGRADAAVQSALDYLRRTQDVSGSWSSDALSTALALKLVGTASGAQPDTDGDGISDAIEAYLGTDPNRADAKLLALGNDASAAPAGPDTIPFTYAAVRGAALHINLPVTDAASCCTTTSGSLPAGVTLTATGSPLTLKLTGTPTEVGAFDQRLYYRSAAGSDKAVQLRLEVEPTLFRADTDPFGFVAAFNADPALAKLRTGWQVAVEDFAGNGRPDFVAYLNGANELFNRLNCAPCTAYAGPDFGQLVGVQPVNGTWLRIMPLVTNNKFTGDVLNMVAVDYNNDGRKDLLLNLNKVITTSVDPADKATTPFTSLVLLRSDPLPGNVLNFTNVTAAVKLDAVPEGRVVVLDANKDGVPDFVVSNGASAAKLYIFNTALGVYEDKSATSGLGALNWPVGVDVDVDAAQTIDIVTLDATTGLRAYKNNGNGTFTSVANETSLPELATRRISRIAPADINGDGLQDLVIFETATQGAGATLAYAGARVTVLNHNGMNASGQPRYTLRTDATLSANSNLPDAVARGGVVGDFDDDGRADILLAARDVSATQIENAIFRQHPDGSFLKLQAETGFAAGAVVHDSPIYTDLNGDGKADLLWTTSAATGYLLLNEGNLNHSIDVIVRGKASNRSALGARVLVKAGGVTQHRQVLAQHAQPSTLHFGLGQEASANVTVKWPDGTQSVVDLSQVDRTVTIVQK
ncbi:FG-GAP-like repeat-containing protein [Aquabacterium sp.]|uniref:FG-GAP-like repeat-containing protein n=1 Tax=Aquabacterium sp. TaxID=1872578 RepID=UPI0025C1F939|nr:FG-GAP-like repeat-containing protein [Aquabacterium sp.]